MSTTLDISDARKQFDSLDERLRRDCVIFITRQNKKAFAVMDLDYLSTVMETMKILVDSQAMRMLKKSLKDIRAGRVHNHKDVEKELG